MFIIPLNNSDANFSQDVDMNEETYTIELRYNTRADKWSFSFKKKNEDYIFQGLFLVLGFDYFQAVTNEDMPDGVLTMVNFDGYEEPTFDNLGSSCKMVWINE